MTWLGALLLGLPYAGALALIAAVGELVPNLGPIVAAIPLVAVGLLVSPTRGLLALLLAVLIQQLENNLIVPRVMGHAVNHHPVAVMLAILSGGRVAGHPWRAARRAGAGIAVRHHRRGAARAAGAAWRRPCRWRPRRGRRWLIRRSQRDRGSLEDPLSAGSGRRASSRADSLGSGTDWRARARPDAWGEGISRPMPKLRCRATPARGPLHGGTHAAVSVERTTRAGAHVRPGPVLSCFRCCGALARRRCTRRARRPGDRRARSRRALPGRASRRTGQAAAPG
jgi:AI-2E family transporter